MSAVAGSDLVCFGYLAYAQIFSVTAYPAANSGAAVRQITPSLAGDAPIAALTARWLGLRVSLVSNRLSPDPTGHAVLHALDVARVMHQARPSPETAHGTPQLVIVTDDAGTRTWFAWLGTAVDQLSAVDLATLANTRLVYVDCYRIIDAAAAAAITASRTPLLLNLGGDPLSDAVAIAASNRRVAFVQTNLDEADAEKAEQVAADLHTRIAADTIIVTLGRLGAFARTATATYRASAPPVTVHHTHGAGAAFSGGLAHAHLAGANIQQALQAACRAGTAHCASMQHIPSQRSDPDLIEETQP